MKGKCAQEQFIAQISTRRYF